MLVPRDAGASLVAVAETCAGQGTASARARAGARTTRSESSSHALHPVRHPTAAVQPAPRLARVRIATWNVNSLRSRIDRVEAFLQRHDIDVLAVQETKAREDQLPLMGLQAAGYDVAAAGVNQWNGVAVISRVGLDDVTVGFDGMPGWGEPLAAESRAIGATCGGVRIWSLYVPNGRKPDDPHYVYKLDWLARLRDGRQAVARRRRPRWSATGTSPRATRTSSTWRRSPRARTSPRPSARRSRPSSTTGTPTSCGRTPPTRRSTPTGTTTGSASSGTAACASTSCSAHPSLAARVTGAFIDRDERAGQGASDHAPVVVDLAD